MKGRLANKAKSLVERAKRFIRTREISAVIFLGQGSQKLGIALCLRPDTRERLFAQLREVLARDPLFVERLIFLITFDAIGANSKNETAALQAELNDTRYAQMAIFLVSCGWIDEREENEEIAVPHYVLGLSSGEYAALYAAKVIDFKSGVLLIYARSQLMALASVSFGGGMLAVKHPARIKMRDINAAIKGTDVVVANSFSSKQLTLSGDKNQLEGIRVLLRSKGYAATPVPVSGAFHHPERMRLVEDGLKLAFSLLKIAIRKPRIKVIFNYTGGLEHDPRHILTNLTHHVVGQVRLQASIDFLIRSGVSRKSVTVALNDKTICSILEDFKWPKAKELPVAVSAQSSS